MDACVAMSDSDSDDVPTLSAHTLAALQEFYSESRADPTSTPVDQFSVGALEEDWVSKPAKKTCSRIFSFPSSFQAKVIFTANLK